MPRAGQAGAGARLRAACMRSPRSLDPITVSVTADKLLQPQRAITLPATTISMLTTQHYNTLLQQLRHAADDRTLFHARPSSDEEESESELAPGSPLTEAELAAVDLSSRPGALLGQQSEQ